MMSALQETGLQQLWMACGQGNTGDGFLSMNCTSPLCHRRAGAFTPSPITGFYAVSTFCDKGDNLCLPQIKSVHIISNWRWHRDLGKVCVRMYGRFSTADGVDDARLELLARSCHEAGIIRSHAVNSIPARHSELFGLGMNEEDNI